MSKVMSNFGFWALVYRGQIFIAVQIKIILQSSLEPLEASWGIVKIKIFNLKVPLSLDFFANSW